MDPRVQSSGSSQATTDGGGAFEIPWLLPGRYRVTASAPAQAEAEAEVEVAPHATASIELTLGLPGTRARP
jgi:hypothetical protein